MEKLQVIQEQIIYLRILQKILMFVLPCVLREWLL